MKVKKQNVKLKKKARKSEGKGNKNLGDTDIVEHRKTSENLNGSHASSRHLTHAHLGREEEAYTPWGLKLQQSRRQKK